MKTIFVPAKSKLKINLTTISEISKKLPKNIAIAYSIQYKEIAEEVKKILSEGHEITNFVQVLGCSRLQSPKNIQTILLISDGKFHAVSLAIETHLPIYILSNNSLTQISKQEIENMEKKQRAPYLKFLNADKIGILISTKPGQENLRRSLEFKKRQTKKKSYLFIANEINFSEFENFPQIQSWVNTACPRLDMNASVVNLAELK